MSTSHVGTSYRAALEALAPSADECLEALRWSVVRDGEFHRREASPESISKLTGQGAEWGGYAFRQLRLTGFIENSIDAFTWQSFDQARLGSCLDLMSGFESTAILRSQFIDMSKVRNELDYRRKDLARLAHSQSPLAAVLSLQKLLVTFVASIGSAELLAEYVTASRAAICYAWADRLTASAVSEIAECIEQMFDLLDANQAREAARACSTMRLMPYKEGAEPLEA